MWTPKLAIVDRPDKNSDTCGNLKIIYWNRETKKYKWHSCRYGKKKSKDKAYEIMTQKQEQLKKELVFDGNDRVQGNI